MACHILDNDHTPKDFDAMAGFSNPVGLSIKIFNINDINKIFANTTKTLFRREQRKYNHLKTICQVVN